MVLLIRKIIFYTPIHTQHKNNKTTKLLLTEKYQIIVLVFWGSFLEYE